jgi:class 3 adenylate cyclase
MSPPTKILVVDDEPDLAALVRQKFRRHIRDGIYTFEMAGDGVEALSQLEKNPDIEIVLTDINMPRMDGLTLLSRIAKLERLLQAIVVSAYGDLDNIRMAMNRGSFDFLMKPIDLHDLEITINKAKETVDQQKKAAQVRETFGRYLSDEVVATLLSKPDALRLGGEKRKITILMSDLRGFSNISERLPPEQVVDILNIYLGKMTNIIVSYSGTIDEFIGDAILVIFGAPVAAPDDAQRAIACAVAMQRAMKGINERNAALGLPRLEMGIALNTGDVIVGNHGSQKHEKSGEVRSHETPPARIETHPHGGELPRPR